MDAATRDKLIEQMLRRAEHRWQPWQMMALAAAAGAAFGLAFGVAAFLMFAHLR